MRLLSVFHLILIPLLLLAACEGDSQSSSPKTAYLTESSDGTLRSDYFKLTMPKPQGWYLMSAEDANQMMGAGAEIFAGDDELLAAQINEGEKRTSTLFALFQYEPGTPIDFNPNILAVAENVKFAPGVKTGTDYFFHTRRNLQQGTLNLEISDSYSQRVIGGIEFDQMDLVNIVGGMRIKQHHYAAVQGEHVILIIQTYLNDEQLQAIEAIIDTIQFED